MSRLMLSLLAAVCVISSGECFCWCGPLLWSLYLHTEVFCLGMLSQLCKCCMPLSQNWLRLCADAFISERVSSARHLLQTPAEDLLFPCPCAPNIFTGHGENEAASPQAAC